MERSDDRCFQFTQQGQQVAPGRPAEDPKLVLTETTSTLLEFEARPPGGKNRCSALQSSHSDSRPWVRARSTIIRAGTRNERRGDRRCPGPAAGGAAAKRKAAHERFTVLTAYDYSLARLVAAAGVPVVLVGDSLGNVILGYPTTVPVTMEDMLHHTAAVVRRRRGLFGGRRYAVPVLSGRAATPSAMPARSCRRGARAVKLERGGRDLADT